MRTGHNSKGENVIENMLTGLPAAASGMLKVGDVIVRIDKIDTNGLGPGEVHELLLGEADSMVRIKYMRDTIEMTVTLTRETGNEHALTEHHGNWKKSDRASRMRILRRAGRLTTSTLARHAISRPTCSAWPFFGRVVMWVCWSRGGLSLHFQRRAFWWAQTAKARSAKLLDPVGGFGQGVLPPLSFVPVSVPPQVVAQGVLSGSRAVALYTFAPFLQRGGERGVDGEGGVRVVMLNREGPSAHGHSHQPPEVHQIGVESSNFPPQNSRLRLKSW